MTDSDVDLNELAHRMRDAASAALACLTGEQRSRAQGAFDVDELLQWTYLPGDRPGVPLRELDGVQRDRVSALLATSYGERGWNDAGQVLRTETLRRGADLDPGAGSLLAGYHDPEYWLRILGEPDAAAPWAWRISGHHLVAQATVVGDVVSTTPQFFGTQPARLLTGPQTGFRGLSREEDLAKQLLALLQPDQLALTVLSPVAPDDILTRDDPIATLDGIPGLPQARMDRAQQDLLQELVAQYVNRAAPAVANRAWDDLRQAGWGAVCFAWAGGSGPGIGHYYSVSGPTLLLEYDNTQEDANHIHSVWRDLRHDWAGDLLSHHYRSSPHPS